MFMHRYQLEMKGNGLASIIFSVNNVRFFIFDVQTTFVMNYKVLNIHSFLDDTSKEKEI